MSTLRNFTKTTLANFSFLNKQSTFQQTYIILDVAVGLIVMAILTFLGILVLRRMRCNRGSNTQSEGNPQGCADEYTRDFVSHTTSGDGEAPVCSNDVNVAVIDVNTSQINCSTTHKCNESHRETESRHENNGVIDHITENSIYSEIESHSLSSEIESRNLYSEAGSHSIYSEVESHNIYSKAEPHCSETYVEHSSSRQYQNIDSFHIEGYITITDHTLQTIRDLDISHGRELQYVNSNKRMDSSRESSSPEDIASDFGDPRTSSNYVFPTNDITISPDSCIPEIGDSSEQQTNYVNAAPFSTNNSEITELKLKQ